MKIGVITLGDHLPDPVTGIGLSAAERYRDLIAQGVLTEQLGLDAYLVGEHHFSQYIIPSPPMLLAAVAQHTQRIRLASGVTLIANQHPARVAAEFSVLDLMSSGRAELCVGRGLLRHTYRVFGHDWDRGFELLQENLEVLLRLWRQPRAAWQGGALPACDGAALTPRPLQTPHPPVWVGAGSDATIDLTSRLGVGLIVPCRSLVIEAMQPICDRYRERFWPANGSQPRVAACAHVFVGRDRAQAQAAWRPYCEVYYRAFAGVPSLTEADYQAILAERAICGGPTEVADRICELRDRLGVDRLLTMFDLGGLPHAALREVMERFAEHVLPIVQGAA